MVCWDVCIFMPLKMFEFPDLWISVFFVFSFLGVGGWGAIYCYCCLCFLYASMYSTAFLLLVIAASVFFSKQKGGFRLFGYAISEKT